MSRECGFTLIEIIVSLILVGILATVGGMGLVTGAKGYLFSKENIHMAQKASLAMARLNRELMELTDVSSAAATSITYEGTSGIRTLGLDNGVIKIAKDPTPLDSGYALVDRVDSFGLSYWSGTDTWTVGTGIERLSAIQFNLVLARSDSGAGNMSFFRTVIPRNNRNTGGAPPTTDPPSDPQSGYPCFVGAAASDQPDQSGVFFLRQFRDIPPLMLYVPLGIPFFLLLCWLVRHILQSLARQRHLSLAAFFAGHKGSVLIGLITTMVIFAALGAALVPMTGTSTIGQAAANSSTRAYLLAESGYRYAASQFMNAGSETARLAQLEALHNQTFTLSLNNDGQFHLDIYPYYFITTSDPNGGTSLQAKVPGGFPPGLTFTSGRLKTGSDYYDYSAASQNGQNMTFTMTQTMPTIPVGTNAFSVATSDNQSQDVSEGGDLDLDAGTADVFPLRNGNFRVNGKVYSYTERSTTQLKGIRDPYGPYMQSFTVDPSSDIVLEKFVKLHSTGTFGQGSMASSREVVYNTPIGWLAGAHGNKEWHDTFDDKSHWFEEGDGSSTLGSHAIASKDGGNALSVTGTDIIQTNYRASLIALNWATTDVNLAWSWALAGNLLTYDAQVKIRVDSEPFYMAGISFRLDASGNSYGVSLLSAPSDYVDGVPNEWVPIAGQPMVVLWQQTNGGASRKWLAYKALGASDYIVFDNIAFIDEMEEGASKWTAESPWGLITYDYHSPTTCWTDSPGYNYNISYTSKSITSQGMDLSGLSNPVLSFWHRHDIDCDDKGSVEISTDGGSNWVELANHTCEQWSWENQKIDISSYSGYPNVKIRFRLIVGQNLSWSDGGWSIDDVVVYDSGVYWPTLLVRVEEKVADSGRFAGQRVNDIRVYFGDPDSHGTANDDPLDNNRLANPRDQINWPPDTVDDTAADNDFFTLVQWDANVDTSVDRLGTGKELNAIIRSNTITTPTSGEFTAAELALHTWGLSSTHVSFDDFAILLAGGGGGIGFMPPIQE